MNITKPAIPKGTRDFTPDQMMKRNFIFDTIKGVFQTYGYLPIETPAMENTSTLLGKYGDEGDRLIFKIFSRGEKLTRSIGSSLAYLKPLNKSVGQDNEDLVALGNVIQGHAEEALRYDLTVPFARFVVQHQNELTFPFKRYQIQPVWRADRPQKGRYREFYQCDVDVIGSDSLLNEVELIQIMDEVFTKLNIKATIKINNRKILAGIAQLMGESDRFSDLTVILDKLDKIGLDQVINELKEKGLRKEGISYLQDVLEGLSVSRTFEDRLAQLRILLKESDEGIKGVAELENIFKIISTFNFQLSTLELDITLARGLNYYTGAIFEVVCDDFPSSICGGGRYDDLTSIFGLNNVSGVGISFGADRIYDVMLEQNLFPEQVSKNLAVLFINFGEQEAEYCLHLLVKLRKLGIASELFPDAAKMKKQMKYANDRGVRKVVIIGSQEMEKGIMSVKDMETGEQQDLKFEDLIKLL